MATFHELAALFIRIAPLLLLAAVAKCAVDIMSHQPDNNKFMNWGPWWDNRNSWKRKYKNYDAGDLRPWFPGSKTWLVAFTDFWHTADFVYLSALQASVFVYRGFPWWAAFVAVAATKLLFGGVFEALYKRAFRIK